MDGFIDQWMDLRMDELMYGWIQDGWTVAATALLAHRLLFEPTDLQTD